MRNIKQEAEQKFGADKFDAVLEKVNDALPGASDQVRQRIAYNVLNSGGSPSDLLRATSLGLTA